MTADRRRGESKPEIINVASAIILAYYRGSRERERTGVYYFVAECTFCKFIISEGRRAYREGGTGKARERCVPPAIYTKRIPRMREKQSPRPLVYAGVRAR